MGRVFVQLVPDLSTFLILHNLTKCTHVHLLILLPASLRLVHEERNQELDHAVIQTHHLSVLHALVESQALGAPQQVFPGVVGIGLHRESQRVELVAEEGEEVAVCDHSLGYKGPGDVLVVPETCRDEREA